MLVQGAIIGRSRTTSTSAVAPSKIGVARIMQKFGVDTFPQLIAIAIELGLPAEKQMINATLATPHRLTQIPKFQRHRRLRDERFDPPPRRRRRRPPGCGCLVPGHHLVAGDAM